MCANSMNRIMTGIDYLLFEVPEYLVGNWVSVTISHKHKQIQEYYVENNLPNHFVHLHLLESEVERIHMA